MRHHRSVSLVVTGSFLMTLAGCAADSTKSAPEAPSPSPIAQTEAGKDQPPSAEVQERAVVPFRPPAPIIGAAPPLYVAPTQDLTLVANALVVHGKSLSLVVTVPSGLTLSHPVHIRLDFSSPGYGGVVQEPHQITCPPCSGYGCLYPPTPPCYDMNGTYGQRGAVLYVNDSEGNGQSRSVTLTITLSDDSGHSFNFGGPRTFTLTPLYFVSAFSGQFRFLNNCAQNGAFWVHWGWRYPDGTWYTPSQVELSGYGGTLGNPVIPAGSGLPSGVSSYDISGYLTFNEFSFNAVELSWSALQQLHMPAIGFWVSSNNVAAPWVQPSTVPIPHTSFQDVTRFMGVIEKDLPNIAHPSPTCVANFRYSFGAGLMTFPTFFTDGLGGWKG